MWVDWGQVTAFKIWSGFYHKQWAILNILLKHFYLLQVELDTTANWHTLGNLTKSSYSCDWTRLPHHKCTRLRKWQLRPVFVRMIMWPIKIIVVTFHSSYSTGCFVCVFAFPVLFWSPMWQAFLKAWVFWL